MSARIAFVGLSFLLAVACTPSADAPPPVTRAAVTAPILPGDGSVPAKQWRAVLVAGDSATPAFDNGVEEMRARLRRPGVVDITAYSADPASVPRERLSSSANVAAAL